jgi:extracellular factor (EF) 3-hydroxypalmitic acid methyl ester biosynthesis protein
MLSEACHTALSSVVSDLTALATHQRADPQSMFNAVASLIHRLCVTIRHAELAGLDKAMILDYLGPARAVHSQSPFVRRLQTWPRGYAGDYETIEYLFEGRNQAKPDSIGYFIERYALTSGVAQQHRNKIAWQASRILGTCRRPEGARRILSLACGGSRDLRSVLPYLEVTAPTIVLNDVDRPALELSASCLSSISSCLTLVPGDAFQAIRTLKKAGPYDLILTGGVFDYLDDRQAVWLLRHLRGMATDDASICLTNIAPHNPYRVWIEYMANWTLIERSYQDLERLIRDGGLGEGSHPTVSLEESGLTHLVELRRPH